jgi:hypothetical protein
MNVDFELLSPHAVGLLPDGSIRFTPDIGHMAVEVAQRSPEAIAQIESDTRAAVDAAKATHYDASIKLFFELVRKQRQDISKVEQKNKRKKYKGFTKVSRKEKGDEHDKGKNFLSRCTTRDDV